MADRKRNEPVGDEVPQELRRPGGPADYDEGGGTGLEVQPRDEKTGGGPSGGEEEPVRGPGIPDDADRTA